MAKYKTKAGYRSVFQRNGTNETIVIGEGETVDLDDELAGFINRDCPGVLVRAKGTAKKAATKKE